MLKISVTTIDQFNQYLNDPEADEEKLISYITGTSETTKYMQLGTAFHDVLQNPHDRPMVLDDDPDKSLIIAENGISFPWTIIAQCYNYVDHNFPFEVRREKIYTLANGLQIKVVGKADQLKGREVNEIKTNWSYFTFDKYRNSCQWKYYAEMYGADKVNYIVFCMKETELGISLYDIHKFSFETYSRLEQDNFNLLTEFSNFIQSKNLESYFEEKAA